MDSNSKIIRLFKSGFEEILFLNRNKTYGAYQLRFISRASFVLGFIITLIITFIVIASYIILNKGKSSPIPVKIIKYDSFDMSKKEPIIFREPPKGDPNAKDESKTQKANPKPSKAHAQKQNKIDPTKIEKDAKEADKLKSIQDSINKSRLDSINNKRIQDSLKSIADEAKGKLGIENGNIDSKNIDTTQHPVIGGPTEFGKWLANELSNKYTPELKAYGRNVTFTVSFYINYDSTITNPKLVQKVYRGAMDDIIIETIKNCKVKFKPAINPETKLPIKSQICMTRVILLGNVNTQKKSTW